MRKTAKVMSLKGRYRRRKAYDEPSRFSAKSDVILVGEIRDSPTASAALTVAETGHLVLGTVHASSPTGVIERMNGLLSGLPDAKIRLAFSLRGVVHLTLRNDGEKAERKASILPVDGEAARAILRDELKDLAKKTTAERLKNA